ncbi:ABC transporter ATP-binding protein [Microbacterium sp. No. 7]|uniref:ABC transporter ATP-binding protein n=1 Tax=Microbacterium sp. No. 7 TaxID=1714373 RepID=UPI0006D05817|nr:ABC transporter ATP-binding protein [Microbacterium sp. No. 7]ALJ19376.1 ABC transporter ATP-binding protein [Microbacterium sp. No. 7]
MSAEPLTPRAGSAPAPVRPSIIVDGVQKTFLLNHAFSFKDTVVSWIRRRKTTSVFEALSGVDLVIGEGESVAILGLNGSGKSTLLKLVSGVMEPDAGQVLTRGRVAGLIEVGAGFHPELSGRENVFLNAAILGMQRKEIEERYDEIVAFSEIEQFIDQEVKHYSSGMFMRLAFSVAIHVELDILLVDEILSVGDAPFREKCRVKFEELIEQGKTLLVVSHDLEMVRQLCTRGIVISKGRVVFDGDIAAATALVEG